MRPKSKEAKVGGFPNKPEDHHQNRKMGEHLSNRRINRRMGSRSAASSQIGIAQECLWRLPLIASAAVESLASQGASRSGTGAC